MKLFDIHVIMCHSASDFHPRCKKKRMVIHPILKSVKLVSILAVAVLVLLVDAAPLAQKSVRTDFPTATHGFLSFSKSDDSSVKEILRLANMIRLITQNQLPEAKMLRYAGLIFHASQKHGVNPVEIIALIMAESNFKEDSINKETGDYGLGQINWGHWGKDYGLTTQELLDPSINVFLTCHVYKFFGQDFGKYHRGNGIQSNAYLVNVKGILSTLNAIVEEKKENLS